MRSSDSSVRLAPLAAVAALACLAGCSSLTEVSRPDLALIVERDAIAFDLGSVPDEIVDRLAANRLVIIGETHFIREHRELTVELLTRLHARGFRQFLIEWPQMADCLVDDYLGDGELWPDWEPPWGVMPEMIGPIREFNRTLPEADRLRVHMVDVNLDDYGGVEAFLSLLGDVSAHLGEPPPIEALLAGGYQGAGAHRARLQTLRDELDARGPELSASWGDYWYKTLAEMVDVELASVRIRGIRSSDYDRSVRLREDEMKRLADRRLADAVGGTVINVGGNHAQKSYLKGTEQEWLGDYLVHRSTAVGGPAIVVSVNVARIIVDGRTEYQFASSPENELFRLTNERWPDRVVFLPLDDPAFGTEGVLMNFEDEIYKESPKRIYDAFVLLPLAHRTLPR